LIFHIEPAPAKDSTKALRQRTIPPLVAFATGCAFGWLFGQDFLRVLIDPWVDPNTIHETYPSSERLSGWLRLISATAGLVLVLPWLTILPWRFLLARSTPTHRQSGYAFIVSSYAAIGSGLALAAFVLLPAFALRQREIWHGLNPVPWAFVELELCSAMGVALAFQLGTFFTFARFRSLKQHGSDRGTQSGS
jgi:Sec-independent protein secretion pathway component TatC